MSSKKTGQRIDDLEKNMFQMAKVYEQVLGFIKIANTVNERLDKLEKEVKEFKEGLKKDG